MTTASTDTKTYAMLDVELRLRVPVPRRKIEEIYGDPAEISEAKLWDVLNEDPDAIFDALFLHLDNDGQPWSVTYDEDEEREPQAQPEFRKPRPGHFYALPVPGLIDGAVTMTEEGFEPVTESAVNRFTDEQINGAYTAARKIWGMPWMGLAQRIVLSQYLSELQWAMLARPSLHRFKAGDWSGDVVVDTTYPEIEGEFEEDGSPCLDYSKGEDVIEHRVFDPTLCHYCGHGPDGHIPPKADV